MSAALSELLMNVMMRMIAGKRYYGENVSDAKEARWFREMTKETFRLAGETYMGDFFPALNWLGVSGLEKKMMVLQEKRDGFMQELIEESRRKMTSSCGTELGENMKKNKTMIEALLSMQETEPEYYTDEIIKGFLVVRFLFCVPN